VDLVVPAVYKESKNDFENWRKVEVNAYVDASFGVYKDMKSVTGVVIMIGAAKIYVKSGKQKLLPDLPRRLSWWVPLMRCPRLFGRESSCHIKEFAPGQLQENQSTICLANKGKRTRHVKIRYFFIQHY
jgi:hypothetical protein